MSVKIEIHSSEGETELHLSRDIQTRQYRASVVTSTDGGWRTYRCTHSASTPQELMFYIMADFPTADASRLRKSIQRAVRSMDWVQSQTFRGNAKARNRR